MTTKKALVAIFQKVLTIKLLSKFVKRSIFTCSFRKWKEKHMVPCKIQGFCPVEVQNVYGPSIKFCILFSGFRARSPWAQIERSMVASLLKAYFKMATLNFVDCTYYHYFRCYALTETTIATKKLVYLLPSITLQKGTDQKRLCTSHVTAAMLHGRNNTIVLHEKEFNSREQRAFIVLPCIHRKPKLYFRSRAKPLLV